MPSKVRKKKPSTNILKNLGKTELRVGDMPDLQIEFLEELCKLWPFALDRNFALKDGDQKLLDKLRREEQPIKDRALRLLKILYKIRIEVEKGIIHSTDNSVELIRKRCKEEPIFFINHFCYLHEPRMPEIGLSARLPFIMYPAQQKIVEAIEMSYQNRQDLLVDKSREAGISWAFCALALHHFLFVPGYSAIMASEKEEKVDVLGSNKPLFGKLRYLMYNLPLFLRPTTFDKENGPNDNFRRMRNPDNGAEISGEAGLNIGRSGRASMVFIDESQSIENPMKLDLALESVTNCRIDVGTPEGMNHFGKKRHSGLVNVATIGWWQDPRKNPEWNADSGDGRGVKNPDCAWRLLLDETRDPVVIAQEYELDYQASVEGLFIPSAWVNAAVDFPLEPTGEKVGGFDIAGHGKNESVYVTRDGPVIGRPRAFPFDTPSEALWAAFDHAEEDNVGLFSYDANGIGESIWGQLKTSGRKIPFIINGIDSGAAASKTRWLEDEGKYANEKFANKRAELWWNVRKRFEKTYEHKKRIKLHPPDEMISIPNDALLIQQLTSPKILYGARIAVESKKEMKKRGIDSPDRADALVYCCGDYHSEENVIDEFRYDMGSQHFTDFEVNHIKQYGDSYAVIYQAKDLTTSVLACHWKGPTHGLEIYDEFVVENGLPDDVINFITESMVPDVKHIKEWVANDAMFKSQEKGTMAPWRIYRKAGIRLKQNLTYDPRGGMMLANQMFKRDLLRIHKDCLHLFSQLREGKRGKSGLDETLGLVHALCLIVTRLKKLKEIAPHRWKEDGYGGKKFTTRDKA